MRIAIQTLAIGIVAFACTQPAIAQNGFAYPDRQMATTPTTQFDSTGRVQQATYQATSDVSPRKPTGQLTGEVGFPSLTPREADANPTESASSGSIGPLVTTGCSLAIVLGLFAGLVWVTRRFGNGSMTQTVVPSDVIKSLGSTMIDARTRVTMLRCGERIIVMAQTQGGVHPLSEITDPAEVRRLTTACLGESPATFAETLRQTEPERGGLFTA